MTCEQLSPASLSPSTEHDGSARVVDPSRVLRPRDLLTYASCESGTEWVIYFMVVFSPWAFGTTQPWSIWTMNSAGYTLGLLFLIKLWIRWRKGFRPARWGHSDRWNEPAWRLVHQEMLPSRGGLQSSAPGGVGLGEAGLAESEDPKGAVEPGVTGRQHVVHRYKWRHRKRGWDWRLTALITGLTLLILGYCLVSALNARATYLPDTADFIYRKQVLRWLPHSQDSASTWSAFWNYLALAGVFLALRDWLLGKSARDQQTKSVRSSGSCLYLRMPDRLRHLLWVLAVSGGLLALEGIAQRFEGQGNLLFLLKPTINKVAMAQFGPYAYHGNAAAYFNLLWPVCLGAWWTLQRSREGGRKHHLLLLCAGLMAACPIISSSRAGAAVDCGLLVAGTAFLFFSSLHQAARGGTEFRKRTRSLLLWFCAGALLLGYAFGWKALQPRWSQLAKDFTTRDDMYELARPMAADYPVFGTGPGTFASVFSLYRTSADTYWPAQAHNDWLETRITFGLAGSALISLAFVTVLLRWFFPGGVYGGRRFVVLTWFALAGCLVHARFDFPFQIYSILLLFLVLCAILSVLTRTVPRPAD